MIKLSRTGITTLKRQYKSVLLKCLLINAGILLAAGSANAAVSIDTSGLSVTVNALDTATGVTGTATISGLGTAAEADAADFATAAQGATADATAATIATYGDIVTHAAADFATAAQGATADATAATIATYGDIVTHAAADFATAAQGATADATAATIATYGDIVTHAAADFATAAQGATADATAATIATYGDIVTHAVAEFATAAQGATADATAATIATYGDIVTHDAAEFATATDLSALDGRVTTAEGKITTLEGKVDMTAGATSSAGYASGAAVNAAVTAIDGALKTAEDDIDTLEGKVANHTASFTTLAGIIDGGTVSTDGVYTAGEVLTAYDSKSTLTGVVNALETNKQENLVIAADSGLKLESDGKTLSVLAGAGMEVTSAGVGIKNLGVTTDMLGSKVVTTEKIADSAVDTLQIKNLAVTTDKLAEGAVTSAKIADGTIVADDLADGAVTTAKLDAGAVTYAKLNADLIGSKTDIENGETQKLTTAAAVKAYAAGIDADNVFTGFNTFKNDNGIKITNAAESGNAQLKIDTTSISGETVLNILAPTDGIYTTSAIRSADSLSIINNDGSKQYFLVDANGLSISDGTDEKFSVTSADGNVTAAGTATFGKKLTVQSGGADITGDTSITGALDVTGDTSITGALDVTGDTSVGGALDVTGDTSVGGALDVTGDASVGGALDVTGDTSVGGALDVTGDTSVGGALDVTGDASVGGALDVTGDASVGGALDVTGDATLKSALTVDGAATLNDTLTVKKLTTLNSDTGLTFDGDTTKVVKAIDDGSAKQDSSSATKVTDMATVATVLMSAENAEFTGTVTKDSTGAKPATLKDGLELIGDVSSFAGTGADDETKNALYNGGTTAPTTLAEAANNISATLGTIHGLANKLGPDYQGNLAEGTTVEQHLTALDSAIGNRARFAEGRYTAGSESVVDAVMSLDENLDGLANEVRDFKKEYKSGMAQMAAMSALVPNARAHGNTQISVGTGAYEGHTAAAVGGFHWINDNLLLNAGVSYGNSNNVAYRAGLTWSW